jgi:hypothetical protein
MFEQDASLVVNTGRRLIPLQRSEPAPEIAVLGRIAPELHEVVFGGRLGEARREGLLTGVGQFAAGNHAHGQ